MCRLSHRSSLEGEVHDSSVRNATCLGVALLLGLKLASAAEVQGASESHEQFAEFWQIESPVFSVRTTTGDVPPLREAADRVYRDHIEARKTGRHLI